MASTASTIELAALQALQTTEQIQLLDVVDALRAHGLSEFTALPQLIVCGDQSSGKSSVLEAISGVPFPRKDNLCTRFATEVILRRTSVAGITVSLVAGKARSSTDRERLSDFRHVLTSREGFPALFEQAQQEMGLSGPGANAFSEDTLRVEISGPDQPQLTIVDLPGLIHSENKKQSSQDVELVKSLVANYMANPRSIILAVVTAKNEFANQIVLKRAREVDPRGLRTLGIITKPDTLSPGSALEKDFLGLARNEDVKFQLGWHVVRNLDTGGGDCNNIDRDEQETLYFRESNFKNLPPRCVGIVSLRKRLSQVLFDQVRAELPRLMEDIESGISICRSAVERLGPSRSSVEEQRAFLIELSQEFSALCKDAIRGDYEDTFFQERSYTNRRLCATVINMHVAFEEETRLHGARWVIVERKLRSSQSNARTRDEAIQKVYELLKESRGRELPGLPNPLLVGEIFREYSQPWRNLARQHISKVWESTKSFLDQALHYFIDHGVSDAILRHLIDPIMEEKLSKAYLKLEELLAVHRDPPLTTNHYFRDTVQDLRQKRNGVAVEERLRMAFTKRLTLTENDIPYLLSIIQPKVSPDMDRVAAEDAFDNMNAFYKVAMKLFVDNVPTLAIQAVIIAQVPSMFCPKSVFAMDSELVSKIASESEEKKLYREELNRKLGTLDSGRQICKQYAARTTSSIAKKKSDISEPDLTPEHFKGNISDTDSRDGDFRRSELPPLEQEHKRPDPPQMEYVDVNPPEPELVYESLEKPAEPSALRMWQDKDLEIVGKSPTTKKAKAKVSSDKKAKKYFEKKMPEEVRAISDVNDEWGPVTESVPEARSSFWETIDR